MVTAAVVHEGGGLVPGSKGAGVPICTAWRSSPLSWKVGAGCLRLLFERSLLTRLALLRPAVSSFGKTEWSGGVCPSTGGEESSRTLRGGGVKRSRSTASVVSSRSPSSDDCRLTRTRILLSGGVITRAGALLLGLFCPRWAPCGVSASPSPGHRCACWWRSSRMLSSEAIVLYRAPAGRAIASPPRRQHHTARAAEPRCTVLPNSW